MGIEVNSFYMYLLLSHILVLSIYFTLLSAVSYSIFILFLLNNPRIEVYFETLSGGSKGSVKFNF